MGDRIRALIVITFLVALVFPASLMAQGESDDSVGRRPYEMGPGWANRTEPAHPPLVDFEDLSGWTVECINGEGAISRSREQQMWGDHVGKLTYAYTGEKDPRIQSGLGMRVMVRPPEPIRIREPFDCINLWVYGNNYDHPTFGSAEHMDLILMHLKSIPPAGQQPEEILALLQAVNWQGWYVLHYKLSPEDLEKLQGGVVLEGILVYRRTEDAVGSEGLSRNLYFDDLAVYQEVLQPLEFEPRPKRGIDMFPGQGSGTNVGGTDPERLPFPTREETILPDNLTSNYTVTLEESGGVYGFHYRGNDGHLIYRYQPQTGLLTDVTAQWEGRGSRFHPLVEGGVYFWTDNPEEHAAPESATLIECHRDGDTVVATWQYLLAAEPGVQRTAEVTYTFRLWQKSLVVDVKCLGGEIGEVRIGKAVGIQNPRLVTVPFLTCDTERPAVLVSGLPEAPLFTTAFVDYYRSNASKLWAKNEVAGEGVTYNGGSRYLSKTDGLRNDCFERLFLTVSPRFEEVLPNIPNPQSSNMEIAGERVWAICPVDTPEASFGRLKKMARFGMTQMIITEQATGWLDHNPEGESTNLRTRPAPERWKDIDLKVYLREVQKLGFRFGIYNQYKDFTPISAHWSEDDVVRTARRIGGSFPYQWNGNWKTAWMGTYAIKPARAPEYERALTPLITERLTSVEDGVVYTPNAVHCDTHTNLKPWKCTDYDDRVPGAGTFAAVFYAWGELLLHQSEIWGPATSEGREHWYYAGLADVNFGSDMGDDLRSILREQPWLVDFDLRKIHPLSVSMGGLEPILFLFLNSRVDNPREELDAYLAATLGFGHTGMVALRPPTFEADFKYLVKTYFSLQQVCRRYATETAADIRYAGADGRLLETSAAVATGAFERSQVFTRYSNDLVVLVNGNRTENWVLPSQQALSYGAHRVSALPVNGWFVEDPQGELVAFSALVDGHRVDYVDSPEYIYADGRGIFTFFEKVACDRQLIVHKGTPAGQETLEVIPVSDGPAVPFSFGLYLPGREVEIVALDKAGNPLSVVPTAPSTGWVYVTHLGNAVSYLVRPKPMTLSTVLPNTGYANSIVVLYGDGFGLTQHPASRVVFKSGDVHINAEVLSWSASVIVCQVPARVGSDLYEVRVIREGRSLSNAKHYTIKPYINFVKPPVMVPRAVVIMNGRSFGRRDDQSQVIFSRGGETYSAVPFWWSNNVIGFLAPDGPPGVYLVKVVKQAGESPSIAVTMLQQRSGRGGFFSRLLRRMNSPRRIRSNRRR